MNRKAVIFGIKGYNLTNKEKVLFKKIKPWGIILFSRNIKNIDQLKSLIKDIKNIFGGDKYPILIDQEGGRVSRLDKIVRFDFFSQDFFARLYIKNKKLFRAILKVYIDKVCEILNKVGININTSPVLDVRRKKSHNIIGNRSFSENANTVSKLGKFYIDFYKNNNIATVTKHIPGHGMSKKDSHYQTPVVKSRKKELIKNDFKPFKTCKSLFSMTAHIIYDKYDKKNTATHSKVIIKKIIRDHINFNGLLISDDISMRSLRYNLEKNATMALQAGCNLVMHCNGKIDEMTRLGKVIPKIDKFTQKKTSHFYKFLDKVN